MNPAVVRRLYGMAAAIALGAAAMEIVRLFLGAQRTPLAFDDAYMFMRYAHNVRHGFGYSWNPDGVHTYGPTSLLWSLCTLLLSFLPADAWTQLLIGSGVCSVIALVAMAWAVAVNARTRALRSIFRVLPLVVVPLMAAPVFLGNQFTGMETMLAMALCALFAGLAMLWTNGRAQPAVVGAAAFLLLLARPESALVGVLLPALLWLLHPGTRPPLRQVAVLYGVFFGAATLQVLGCQVYFGTPVPLSVYMKGRNAYLGYRGVWHPELLLTSFLTSVQLFLAAWLLLAFGLPLLAIFAYLQSVNQIMGFSARYYTPYLPLIVIPALLLLDRRLADGAIPAGVNLRWRGGAVAAAMVFFLLISSEAVQQQVRRAERHARDEYDTAQLTIEAKQPLPVTEWQPMMFAVTDDLVAPLPQGVTVAATEVGYLGERASQASIIDLAGLNDTAIAMHGFSMAGLLKRKPDLIWMPHSDYTYQRGVMFGDPDLLQQYDVYAGAANYGLAVRKDSPYRAAIDRQLQVFWAKMYPGTVPADYLVRAAHWTGAKHAVYGE